MKFFENKTQQLELYFLQNGDIDGFFEEIYPLGRGLA